jgi:hypothetical protein
MRWIGATLFSAASICLTGCTASLERTDKLASDFNRVFAKSRSEGILLNVLRASEKEPLQFSTMGTVSGTVRSTSEISLPFNNIILGGDASINPTIGLKGGPTPSVSFVPLSNKEFTQGLLRPVDAETMDYLLGQGRDREHVLPLAIGGVTCDSDDVLILRGNDLYQNWQLFYAAHKASGYSLDRSPPEEVATLRLLPSEVASYLKDGLGQGRSISAIKPYKGSKPRPGEKEVVIKKQGDRHAKGIILDSLCRQFRAKPISENKAADPFAADDTSSLELVGPPRPQTGRARANGVLIRSVASMFYYLAELARFNLEADMMRCGLLRSSKIGLDQDTARTRAIAEYSADRFADAKYYEAGPPPRQRSVAQSSQQDFTREEADLLFDEALRGAKASSGNQLGSPLDLFRVHLACAGERVPADAVISTRFRGNTYFVLPASERDLTLQTISVLSDLIALQTSESSITNSSPLIAIQQ